MNYLIKILSIGLAVFVAAEILPGVAVSDFKWALVVALCISLLNTFVKPVLILLTIPATILSLGLFFLVINAVIILLADYFISSGFEVNGFWYALLFSMLLSIFTSLIERITGQKKTKKEYRN